MPLPVSDARDLFLDLLTARAHGLQWATQFQSATPFAHVVLDDFLPQSWLQRLLDEFPAANQVGYHQYDIGYRGSLKRQYAPQDCSVFCRQFFLFLNSAPFLEFLEAISGTPRLIPDPHYEGGGFHETLSGGYLGIHRDFRIHKRLNVLRRLNFILYLNPDWKTDYGGELELWSRDMQYCVQRITPILNRCVIFSCDDSSFHGHPEPLCTPPELTRRSIATYYYSASDKIWDSVSASRTHFVARPQDNA